MIPYFGPETTVWNVEGGWGQYRPRAVSKFHVARPSDAIARCSPRVILNLPLDPSRSHGDGSARLGDLDRDQVCRKCVPVMPEPEGSES